ncbi:hypothetical protein MOSE0_C00166 [Monosporozyma servazzii]
MSHNGIRTVTPSKSGTVTTKKEPSPSSMEEKEIKLENLEDKVDSLELIKLSLTIVTLTISGLFLMIVWVPYKVYGISIYTILLVSHSLLFSCLFVVHIYLLPPLVHERYIISYEVEGKTRYLPVYHPSKNELYWCYQKLCLSLLTNALIWKYLSKIDLELVSKDNFEFKMLLNKCICLGFAMLLISIYSLLALGPLYDEAEIEKPKTKQEKQNTDLLQKDASYSKLLQEKDASYLKLLQEKDNILMEKDNILMELLQEKNKENERLRKENEEANNKTNGSPQKTKSPKKGNKSAGRSY